jgi:hypothetical protein
MRLTAWFAEAGYVFVALVAFGRLSERRLRHQLHALEHVMILESIITCPHCRTTKAESMPTDACRFLYECSGCGATLRPKPGDCCVFCSYGSVPCPPIQAGNLSEPGVPSCAI